MIATRALEGPSARCIARVLALVPKSEILYFIAFVDRGALRRVISLRRANRREAKHYVKAIEKSSDTDPECS